MSNAWSWYITILTLANVLGCVWLIRWTSKPVAGEAKSGDVTGHTWDETLQEYNNPLPRWWLWLFYITIVFGLIYFVLYPALGNYKGMLGWTQKHKYEQEMAQAKEVYGPIFAAYAKTDIPALTKNADAMRAGQRLFLNYCATCHGSDAGGARGFPNLRDDDWLYGGAPEQIKTTILDGRQGVMPPMGAALGDEGVDQVAAYVVSLSGRQADADLVSAGKAKFEAMCAACHMADGKGNQIIGAPNLTDNTWLYGRSISTIKKTIRGGRNGVMPSHREFLGEDKVHLLAAYVYSLSAK
jgi:cytochrome c oxidase cbb3-type subunit 3